MEAVFLIEPELLEDSRGFFARTFCQREFEKHGLNPKLVQCSVSFNKKAGTLRGMHVQGAPFQEAKLVRCSAGRIYDVVLDLREESKTYGMWEGFELSASNRRMMFIPEGCAHGFQTLEDRSEVFYQMSEFYSPENTIGVRWDDPAFRIVWPIANPILSDRDRAYALRSE